MIDEIRLTYTVPRELLLRAMRSWNTKPRRIDRGLIMVLIVLLAAGAVIVPALGLSVDAAIAFLLGISVGVALYWLKATRAQRTMIRLSLDAHARSGPQTLTLGPDGFRSETALSLTSSRWAAIDRVIAMNDATVLLTGGTLLPIPDVALPADLPPDAFRARLDAWRTS